MAIKKKRLTLAENLRLSAMASIEQFDDNLTDEMAGINADHSDNSAEEKTDTKYLTPSHPPLIPLSGVEDTSNYLIPLREGGDSTTLSSHSHSTETEEVSHPPITPISPLPNEIKKFGPTKMKFLSFCYEKIITEPNHVVITKDIAEYLQVAISTAKKYIQVLGHDGFIVRESVKNSNKQGIRFTWVKASIIPYLTPISSHSHSTEIDEVSHPPLTPVSPSHPTLIPLSPPQQYKEGRKEVPSFQKTRVDKNSIPLAWPCLSKTGWSQNDYDRTKEIMELKNHNPENIIDAMNKIDFELRKNNGVITDKKGEVVKDVVAWLIRSLTAYGRYRVPEGYLTPAEILAKEKLAEEKSLLAIKLEAQETRLRLREIAFEEWCDSLTKEEAEKVCEGRIGPKNEWLKNYWRKNVADK